MTECFRSERPHHRLRPAFFLVAALATLLVLLTGPEVHAEQASVFEAKVSKILDGDTFTLSGE